jgi:branched-chain amino acid transport system ATP-binding protein
MTATVSSVDEARTAGKSAGKATDPAVVLSVRNIESYYGPIMAIRGCSLEVRAGQIVTVLGANGAGKTTLMKTISGVMDPEKGQIVYGGQNIAGMSPDKIVRMGIVHVPEGREVFPLLTVEENLKMGAFVRDDADGVRQDQEMVFSYFPILAERRRQAAGTLSGGQQQMLAIGRGLMARPKLMLLDEPSLGLSPLLVKEIFQIIRRLNREQGVTMMLVEQNAKVALEVADYGYVMELGRIVMADDAARLLQSKDVQEFYLGVQGETQRGQKRWKQKKTWR